MICVGQFNHQNSYRKRFDPISHSPTHQEPQSPKIERHPRGQAPACHRASQGAPDDTGRGAESPRAQARDRVHAERKPARPAARPPSNSAHQPRTSSYPSADPSSHMPQLSKASITLTSEVPWPCNSKHHRGPPTSGQGPTQSTTAAPTQRNTL
jgi:hypothetical protein